MRISCNDCETQTLNPLLPPQPWWISPYASSTLVPLTKDVRLRIKGSFARSNVARAQITLSIALKAATPIAAMKPQSRATDGVATP
jgi:hypothetical protein